MARGEDEAEKVVSDVIVDRVVEIRHGHLLLGLELAANFAVFALEQLAAAQAVDGAMLRGGHEPGAGIIGDARLGPLFECGDESVLREFLGKADVAKHARETGDDAGRFDAPDGVDGAVGIGSCHGYR
jgi:hypothetical protein